MATCQYCQQDMLTADGCAFATLILGDESRAARIKHDGNTRCGDCNAKPGHYHHLDCDLETCPICRLQLLSCDCDVVSVTTEACDG